MFYKFPSIIDYLSTIQDSSAKEIFTLRLNGKTLEEIGTLRGLTRERIRQIESKFLKRHQIKCENEKIIFAEDRYEYLFKNYYFTRNEFKEIFNEEEHINNYLEIVYDRGKNNFNNALEDINIALKHRRLIEKYIYKNHYIIHGEYVHKTFSALLKYYIKNYVNKPTRITDLEPLIIKFVNDIDNSIEVPTGRAFEGYFERMDVICSKNKQVRYYDFSRFNFDELKDEINLDSYMGLIISTDLFIRKNTGLLVKYDLLDKYELHNLLKKIYGDSNPNITFNRMPFINVGNVDRKDILLDILQEHGELNTGKFCKILDQRLGIKEQGAFWLELIPEYKKFGGYKWFDSVAELTMEEIETLRYLLPQEFYWKKDIIDICKSKYTSFDFNKLSYNNLKKIGFTVNGSYVIKSPMTALDYFKKELLKKDRFAISEFKKYIYLQIYEEVFMELRRSLQIIEFENGEFVNIRRLIQLGITKEELVEECSKAFEFAINNVKGDYFSIHALRNLNYAFKFDALGFKDKFIESLLKFGARTSWVSLDGKCVFRKDKKPFSMSMLVRNIIKDNGCISMNNLLQQIKDNYGVKLDSFDIKVSIKDSPIYLDVITNNLYEDHQLYESMN